MKRKRPWMVVIAGPNGAGKSTFYELVLKDDPLMKNAPFINLDNIAKDISDPYEDPNNNMLTAGKITFEEVEKNIENRQSFVYETTSSGRVHLRFMDAARSKGFKIATVFIGLSSQRLSYMRVQQRVSAGGHDVPATDVNRRYPKIMKNFPDMLKRSDIAAVFDNSSSQPFKLIFLMDDKAFRIFYKYPRWLENSIKERKTSKDMIIMRNASAVHRLNDEELRQISDMALDAVTQKGKNTPLITGTPDSIPADAKDLPQPSVEETAKVNEWLKKAKQEREL